ncbi:tetratricopeptide repeat protein [Marinomonas agarivorans]|nr:tetratricopeptide repeat protein [Marinomonas agarivorans]
MTTDYSKQKALIIEDMAEARILQKKMLTDFGFVDIDVAMKAETAIELLKSRRYDVVFSDYNLGNGKDGQQLLEEVRHSELIPNTSSYLMVTAETSIEMVMGAIEYQPDGYITKPFSQALLQRRLQKLIETKIKLYDVNQALDNKDYRAAIKAADEALKTYPYLESKCTRIKGDCYLELKEYDQAIELFSEAMADRKMPWALFGLAKAYFFKDQYDEAEPRFRQLTLDNRFFVNAYDWLAKCLLKQNKKEEAHATLLEAIEKSPKAILRQMELGRLSMEMGNYDVAEGAYRKAVFLGRYSVHNHYSITINHLKTFLGMAENGQLQTKQLDSFQSSVARAQKRFMHQPEAKAQVYQTEIELYLALNDLQRATLSFTAWNKDISSNSALPPPKEFEAACAPLLGIESVGDSNE